MKKKSQDFKIGDKLIDEINEHFWLDIFTEKNRIYQIPLLIFSGSIYSSENSQGNILYLMWIQLCVRGSLRIGK